MESCTEFNLPGEIKGDNGNRYKFINHIKSGNYGDVYRGIDIDNNKDVAIKVVRKSIERSMNNEIQILQDLRFKKGNNHVLYMLDKCVCFVLFYFLIKKKNNLTSNL